MFGPDTTGLLPSRTHRALCVDLTNRQCFESYITGPMAPSRCMTLIHHQSHGTVMIDGPNTSPGCHGLDDVLLRTIATARKIKISFVFFKLVLSKYGFLSFHSKNMCSREL